MREGNFYLSLTGKIRVFGSKKKYRFDNIPVNCDFYEHACYCMCSSQAAINSY